MLAARDDDEYMSGSHQWVIRKYLTITILKTILRSVPGVIFNVIGNGHRDTSSNSGPG